MEASLLLSDLCDKFEYFSNRDQLIEFAGDEYFYNTVDDIEESTTLWYKVQKRCIKELEKHWLIKTKLMWVPAKLHFTICENKIMQFVNSSFTETANLVSPIGWINNNKEIIKWNNNKEIIVSNDTTPDGEVWYFFSDWFSKNSLEILPPPVPPTPPVEYVPKQITTEINDVIQIIKNKCKEFWVMYQWDWQERNYAKHLLSKKFSTDILEQTGYELKPFLEAIIMLSTQVKYAKQINSAKSIYYNRADTVNKAKKENIQVQWTQKRVFTY